MGVIAEKVAAANAGTNEHVIARMSSGWAVMGDPQVLRGYCLLLADPVVTTLNDLDGDQRAAYLADMARLGDAVLAVTGAARINYEILGNLAPELHAHVLPRYIDEPEDLRLKPAWFYDWPAADAFSVAEHGALQAAIRAAL